MKQFKQLRTEASKYLKYSDLMKAYAVSFAKDGGLGPASKKIKAAMDKEKKKLGIQEANNKTAFVKRVKERFPQTMQFKKYAETIDRIVQVVKPKNIINSKRYVELGNLYDSAPLAKLIKALERMEKKDGIK